MIPQVRKVLEAAIRAPSGENSQPWHFEVSLQNTEAIVDVYLNESSDNSLYNWEHRASYLALGACVENIDVIASTYGLKAEITPFPLQESKKLVARIRLVSIESVKSVLSDAIFERSTNRKPYNPQVLSEEVTIALKVAAQSKDTSIDFVAKEEDKKELARVGATNEAIMLGNESIHNFFFSHVNWTKKSDESKRSGFFVQSLELPPPARVGFMIARSWARCRVLNRLVGFSEIVAKQNAAVYTQAPLFGIITAQSESAESAFASGRAFQACWLEASKQGISIQPLMGTLFLGFMAESDETSALNSLEKDRIKKEIQTVHRIFSLQGKVVYALFRLGYALKPSAYTLRHSVDEVTTWKI